MILKLFLVTALSFTAGWLLLNSLIPTLRLSLLDQPNPRSSHSQPTPRGGGVAFVLVASASSVIAFLQNIVPSSSFVFYAAPLLALPLALTGLLDDRYNLPASLRYIIQLATASSIIFYSHLFVLSIGTLPLLILLLIAVTAVINFTNFMDGLDGLVAGCMAVAMTCAAVQLSAPWPIWALVGSLLGFLILNWSPAMVFMGDVGSTFLGAVFSLLVLQSSTWYEAFGLSLVATPLLGDACLCVPRRFLAGQPVFQPHRLHLFQRLHQAGWPHARVASLYISATAVLAITFLFGGMTWVLFLAVVELFIGVWFDQQVAVPFSSASLD